MVALRVGAAGVALRRRRLLAVMARYYLVLAIIVRSRRPVSLRLGIISYRAVKLILMLYRLNRYICSLSGFLSGAFTAVARRPKLLHLYSLIHFSIFEIQN